MPQRQTRPCTTLWLEKLYALGQWQRSGVIHGNGSPTHIGFPGIGAGLAAPAGLFFAAEGATDFSS